METVPSGDVRFARFLQGELDRLGIRPADLSRRSGTRENGRPVISQDTVSRWLNPPYARPSRPMIAPLARTLGIPPTVLAREAGEYGDEEPDGDEYQLAQRLARLTPKQRAAVKALVDELLDESSESS